MPRAPKSPVPEIVRLHGEIVDSLRLSLDKAIRIGELLTEQKERLGHGRFGAWCAKLPFGQRTAQNYMRLFDQRDRLKSETVSHLTRAYRLLGRKDRDQPETDAPQENPDAPPVDSPPDSDRKQKSANRKKGPADDPADTVPVEYKLTRAESKEWGSLLRFLLEKVFHTADDKATILEALRFAKKEAANA